MLIATAIEGLGTGIGGPPIIQTTLLAVLPSDTGAASAAGSAAAQFGCLIGAALLNTLAITATTGYLAVHAGAMLAATVHGYTVARAWGVGILVVAAVPAVVLVNANAPPAPVRDAVGRLGDGAICQSRTASDLPDLPLLLACPGGEERRADLAWLVGGGGEGA